MSDSDSARLGREYSGSHQEKRQEVQRAPGVLVGRVGGAHGSSEGFGGLGRIKNTKKKQRETKILCKDH